MTHGLILAAGRGSRMGALCEGLPKCLSLLNGKTLLSRQLAALTSGGVDDVAIVGGYRADQLKAYAQTFFTNLDWNTTGIVASLASAAEWLAADATVVSYGDIFYGPQTVAALAACGADIAIAYDPTWLELWSKRFADPFSDGESFLLDADRVLDIGRRIERPEDAQGQYMGLFKLTPAGWRELARARAALGGERGRTVDMTSLLRAVIHAGGDVRAVPRREPWGEVDSASDIELYERLYPQL